MTEKQKAIAEAKKRIVPAIRDESLDALRAALEQMEKL